MRRLASAVSVTVAGLAASTVYRFAFIEAKSMSPDIVYWPPAARGIATTESAKELAFSAYHAVRSVPEGTVSTASGISANVMRSTSSALISVTVPSTL